MVEKTRLLGILIIIVTTSIIVVPGLSMQQLTIGLGISHRASEITAYPNRVTPFEVARLYNTGDEVITIQVVWKPISETTTVSVDLFPPEMTLQPDESSLVTATVATTEQLGSVDGVVEVITLSGIVAPDAFVGGIVVPGAELPFQINVVKEPSKNNLELPEHTITAGVGYGLGGLLVLVEPETLLALLRRLRGI